MSLQINYSQDRCDVCNLNCKFTINDCCSVACFANKYNIKYGTQKYEDARQQFVQIQDELEKAEMLNKQEENLQSPTAYLPEGEEWIEIPSKKADPLKVHVIEEAKKRAEDLEFIVGCLRDGSKDQKRIAARGIEVVATLLRKNADYGSSAYEEPLLTPGLAARTAILVRMSDKIKRFINLTKPGAKQLIKEESIEDTMRDLNGYSLLYLTAPKE